MRGCMQISTEYTFISEFNNNERDIHEYSMQLQCIICGTEIVRDCMIISRESTLIYKQTIMERTYVIIHGKIYFEHFSKRRADDSWHNYLNKKYNYFSC